MAEFTSTGNAKLLKPLAKSLVFPQQKMLPSWLSPHVEDEDTAICLKVSTDPPTGATTATGMAEFEVALLPSCKIA